MNLKREYDAAVLGILQSDGERIAELEAERDELREQVSLLRDALDNMCKSVLNESGAWAQFYDHYLAAKSILVITEPKP